MNTRDKTTLTYEPLLFNPKIDPRFFRENLKPEQKNIHAIAKVKDITKLEDREGIQVTSTVRYQENFIVTLRITDTAHFIQLANEDNIISLEVGTPIAPCWDEIKPANNKLSM